MREYFLLFNIYEDDILKNAIKNVAIEAIGCYGKEFLISNEILDSFNCVSGKVIKNENINSL